MGRALCTALCLVALTDNEIALTSSHESPQLVTMPLADVNTVLVTPGPF